ncbi:MAG: polysaccharide biosynthesis/export family protein, partial [Proteobacteria bacterium]|nr:polysaccharide biosynthesis/export family protein [Pseudomonadota bacterium]
LTSADLIEEVITDLGVENIYPDMIGPSPEGPTPVKEATIKSATFRFKGSLSAAPVKGSNVINVSFKHNDPQVAARAVNQLIESFKVQHIEIFKNPRASFMEKQLAVYRQRLQESEENLEAFKQKNRVFSLYEQRSLLLQQQSASNTSSKETQRGIHELQQQISSVTSQMQTIPKYELSSTDTGKSKNIDDAQNKLLNLKIKENELLSKYEGSNRNISNVRKEIQLIEDYLSQNGLKAVTEREVLAKNGTYQNLEMSLLEAQTKLSSEEARIATLEQQLNQMNGELQDLDAHERELRSLKRELDTNESNFKSYVTKLEDARTEEELDLMRKVNISVIQKATVPLWPIEPNKRFNLLVGIILGIGSGLALAIFSEYCIGRGVCTPEGVEQHLGLPVLASVPYKEKKTRGKATFAMVTIASLFLMLLLLNACSTAVKSPTPFNPRVVQEPSDSIEEYEIHAGDELAIKFFYNPELNETVSVRPDGRISLQFANEVMAAGLTPAELTDILTEKYSTEFVDPKLSVFVRTFGGQMAYVDGEVGASKQLNLHKAGNNDITVTQAIALAGGLKNTA